MSFPTPTTSASASNNNFEAFEGPLMEMAQRSQGDLRVLLSAFFGFLHRRTDFYVVHDSASNSKMGFAPGNAEKVLLAAFRQYPLRKIKAPPPKQEESAAHQPPTETSASIPKQAEATSSKANKDGDSGKSDTTAGSSKKAAVAETSEPRLTEEGLQIPVGNGGSTKLYTWTQNLQECTVLLNQKLAPTIRGRDLDVTIQPTQLTIASKEPLCDDDTDPTIFLQGTLAAAIVPDESTWTLESGVLQVTLYKKIPTFWETIVVGDAKIDTALVDSRRNIRTYDEATQAQIRKIMFDQQQSSRGLPTSDELSKGNKIPPLPKGVEYIDQEILDSKTLKKK